MSYASGAPPVSPGRPFASPQRDRPWAPYGDRPLVGAHDYVPMTTWDETAAEQDAREGEVLQVAPKSIESVQKATWGSGGSNIDVTKAVIGAVRDGGLKMQATNEALGLTAGEDPCPGVKKRLLVRYIEPYYVSPEERIAHENIDTSTVEGKLEEALIMNDRLVQENKRLNEKLVRHHKWDNHYREVEDKLRDEIQKRRQLEQTLYDREGSHVATRLRELEREVTRLRNQVRKEQQAVLDEQQNQQQLQTQVEQLKEAKGGASSSIQQQISALRDENVKLTDQLQDVNRLNVQLQLAVKEEADYDTLRASVFARDNVDPVTGSMPLSTSHVKVRKSVLCSQCKAQVEMWERQALSRGAAIASHRHNALEFEQPSPHHPSLISDTLRTFGSPTGTAIHQPHSGRTYRDPRDMPGPHGSSYPVQGIGYDGSGRTVTKI